MIVIMDDTSQTTNQRRQATPTCRCGASWTGLRIEHCSVCHQTFTGTTSGDKHRVGDFNPGDKNYPRRCLSADEMIAKGMEKNARGHWTNGGTSPWATGGVA